MAPNNETPGALAMPTREEPLQTGDGLASVIWWRFWFGLFRRSAATIPYTVSTGLTATGASQVDALQLDAEWNTVTTTPAGSGVILEAFGVGLTCQVINSGAHALEVYPPVGFNIDGGAPNIPYSLGPGKTQIFSQTTEVEFQSTQLG